jgi:LysR family hca operon transcriptional activator
MELRHLRFFVAVVEEGSFTTAAEKRLHTAQPSLSRQIRDLEQEVGAPLLTRNSRGVEPTAAGRAFLEHARLALAQVDAGVAAARRAAAPAKASFALGFLTGLEIDWLPEAMRILREELPNIEITVSSQNSPDLAEALTWGKLDLAFMRREERFDDVAFRTVWQEPLVVLLPSDHALAQQADVDVAQLREESLVDIGAKATVLRGVIQRYLAQVGIEMKQVHSVDNLAMAISLVASTRGVALMPQYVENFLPWSVVSRPLRGAVPTVDLAIGYRKGNTSPLLALFLSRLDELVARVATRH